jgi:G3E family GTPase
MRDRRRADGRLPLTIIGGFLGAGKSTWLRHQLHERHLGPVHLIVNEAAETSVDNLLLGKAERVEVLAGGCACCAGRALLVAALRRICAESDASGASETGRIVLETSGLADPGAIAAALAQDPILARRLVVADVIVLVDALNGAAQLAEEELSRRQVEAAERIIVTKPRDVPLEALARLTRTLRRLNPAAALEAAELGTPEGLPVDEEAEPYDLPETASMSAEPIRPYRLRLAGEAGWAGVSVWLSALLAARGDDIVRVKGVVTSPDGRLLLQSVRRIVQAPEILPTPEKDAGPGPEDDVIVLIGRGMDEERLARSWRTFVAGEL